MNSIISFLTKKSTCLFFLMLFVFSEQLLSQVPGQVPQASPYGQEYNTTPPVVDPTQLNQRSFKNFFEDNNKKLMGADKNKELATPQNGIPSETIYKDSLPDDNQSIKITAEQTYGANIFKNSAMMNVAELSTPPLDYPIGVGDHIVVALWGGGEYQEDYVVAKDGSIFPSGIGKITVQGLTFENARSLIYSRFKSVVPATTNVQVTLGQPRTINVNVSGEVSNPGPVTVSAFSNAFNVIGLAGGITKYGNLREIKIKRNGKVIETVDVYKYLVSGDMGKHIYLQNNDFVLVSFYEKKVLATGQFKRPMYYQLKKTEGLKALIDYSGGFNLDALTSGVKVNRTEDEAQVIHDVNATAILKMQSKDYALIDGDVVRADLINPGILNKVDIRGSVNYPGLYELRKTDRLFDVINRAGGINSSTYLSRAYIFRAGADSLNTNVDKIEISLKEIDKVNGNPNNIALQPNDVIQIFSNNEFGEQQFVEVFGEVRKEGKLIKYGGMTLQDLIYLSGGLKPSAEFGRLEIVSIVDMDSAQKGLKPTRTVVTSYSILPNLELDKESAKVLLKPFDQVYVRKNPTFQLQQNVTIRGLVKYPGNYAKLNVNERLSSFIERAGGVIENANLAGAVLYRNKSDLFLENVVKGATDESAMQILAQNLDKPVSIDLYKAMKNKNSDDDVILQENDLVIIPENNPFVTVTGSVQSPLKITFDKSNSRLPYYIDKAGGYGIKPWRKRVFVTYANGRSKRTKNFFFMHFYPQVKEGSTITVPARPEKGGRDIGDIIVQSVTATIPIIIGAIIIRNL